MTARNAMAAGNDAPLPHISPDIGICRGYFELSSTLAIRARSTPSTVWSLVDNPQGCKH